MTTKAVDMGRLQDALELARRTARATGKALERAQAAHDVARETLAKAEAEFASAFRTIKG